MKLVRNRSVHLAAAVAAASAGTIAISRFQRAEGRPQASPLETIRGCFPARDSRWRVKCNYSVVSNRDKSQAAIADPISCQRLPHLRPVYFRSSASAIPRTGVLRKGAIASRPGWLSVVEGAWRLAADPGWTSKFFIASGLLSHCQVWFTAAILMRTSSRGLSTWLEKQQ